MPAQNSFNDGNRSEYLALFAFSSIGFPVIVHRQSDYFLTDLIVHLGMFNTNKKKLLPSGLSFSIQIKSDRRKISIASNDQIKVFHESKSPLFIAVVNKREEEILVYSTIRRHTIPKIHQNKKIFIKLLNRKPNYKEQYQPINYHGEFIEFPLFTPFLKIETKLLDSKKEKIAAREKNMELLSQWALIENQAITHRYAGKSKLFLPCLTIDTDEYIEMPKSSQPETTTLDNILPPDVEYALSKCELVYLENEEPLGSILLNLSLEMNSLASSINEGRVLAPANQKSMVINYLRTQSKNVDDILDNLPKP